MGLYIYNYYDQLMQPLKIYRLRNVLDLLVPGVDPGFCEHGRTPSPISHESEIKGQKCG